MGKENARPDPLPVFCFKVLINGTDGAFFKSVSGLRYETEVVPVREGGNNATTYQLVGATKWSNIVLKQGYTGDSALLTWRDEWIGKRGSRHDVKIVALDTALEVRSVWTAYRAWPMKWELSELDASKSELSIETLELAHEGITFSKSL